MEAIVLAAGILLFAGLMGGMALFLENGARRRQCLPTRLEVLGRDVRKDAKRLPETLDEIEKGEATRYTLEIITFVVRFVCRDSALPTFNHPMFAGLRNDFTAILRPCLDVVGVDEPHTATLVQQTQVCRIMLESKYTLPKLQEYCLEHFGAFRRLRNTPVDTRVYKRRDVRAHRNLIPSIEAMIWLRLMHAERTPAS
jgi:hypothetical protein